MTLFVHCAGVPEGNMAHFTSLAGNIAWLDLNYLPLSSSPCENPIFPCGDGAMCWARWYLRAPPVWRRGSTDTLTASLSETISAAGSIVRPTPRAGRVHCLYWGSTCGQQRLSWERAARGSQGEWWCAASDARLLARTEMQPSLRRTSGWMLSSSGGWRWSRRAS